jgi:large subunit ribosomal protein L6
MSRIGKKPVEVPGGVKVALDPKKRTIGIEGPKGRSSYQWHPDVAVGWHESEKRIVCTIHEAAGEEGAVQALWGTTRARIQSMIDGVTKGYERKLEIVGVGWTARVQGRKIVLNVGYANPVELAIPEGVNVAVEGSIITVTGHDKKAVGQLAADIRAKRKPEPYNGKGIKYTDEVIQRKQGKAFGA